MAGDVEDAQRLEDVWAGDFGDQWIDRNIDAYDGRGPFWESLITRLGVERVLEVGCNVGGNLRWIEPRLPAGNTYGVDINRRSVELIHAMLPGANVLVGSARELPFRDDWFDLVFTVGVLIHQPDGALQTVMREIARCSSRYVLCGELFSPDEEVIDYRGVERAIYKRDYGPPYLEAVPGLTLLETRELTQADGFNGVTCWLFEKQR